MLAQFGSLPDYAAEPYWPKRCIIIECMPTGVNCPKLGAIACRSWKLLHLPVLLHHCTTVYSRLIVPRLIVPRTGSNSPSMFTRFSSYFLPIDRTLVMSAPSISNLGLARPDLHAGSQLVHQRFLRLGEPIQAIRGLLNTKISFQNDPTGRWLSAMPFVCVASAPVLCVNHASEASFFGASRGSEKEV